MAYGKNKKRKDWDFRAYPLGIGAATQSKKGACQVLMTRVLDLMQAMSEKCFVKEALAHDDSLEQIEQTLIEMQSQCDTLNAVWAEQARKHVKTALQESSKRYFRRLAGSLRHVDTALNVKPTKLSKAQAKRLAEFVGPPEKKRKFVHVPWQIQDEISDWELAELKEAAEQGTAVDLFRRLLVHSDACDLTHNQIAILRDIHRQTQDKHTVPDFGAKGQFTLQLHLDYRMLPSVKRKGQPDKPSEAICLRDGEAYVLKDKKNRKYRRFLDIAGVLPRAPRLRIPVVLTRKIAERMAGTNKEWASIIIELTSDRGEAPTIGARLVCGKPPEAKKIDLKAVTCIVGRDFGYVNTIALSVATITNPVDLTGHTGKEILDDSREEAQAYFEDHVRREGVQIVERLKFEGRHFLDRIARCCDKIDSYTSRIDQGYNALERLRAKIFDTLGLDKNDRITSGLKKTFAGDMVREFFQLLGNIHSWKRHDVPATGKFPESRKHGLASCPTRKWSWRKSMARSLFVRI